MTRDIDRTQEHIVVHLDKETGKWTVKEEFNHSLDGVAKVYGNNIWGVALSVRCIYPLHRLEIDKET